MTLDALRNWLLVKRRVSRSPAARTYAPPRPRSRRSRQPGPGARRRRACEAAAPRSVTTSTTPACARVSSGTGPMMRRAIGRTTSAATRPWNTPKTTFSSATRRTETGARSRSSISRVNPKSATIGSATAWTSRAPAIRPGCRAGARIRSRGRRSPSAARGSRTPPRTGAVVAKSDRSRRAGQWPPRRPRARASTCVPASAATTGGQPGTISGWRRPGAAGPGLE